jgi:hypothetical protein
MQLLIIKPAIFIFLVAGGVPAYVNGNQLLLICEGDAEARGVCMTYITGAVDEWNFLSVLMDNPVCAPNAIGTQLRDAVINYLKAHHTLGRGQG